MNPRPGSSILDVLELSFCHSGQPALVAGWTESIGPGLTQLYGDTGSGKSTILRLLGGALPCAGRLTLTGTRQDEDAGAYRNKVFFCEPAADGFEDCTARACTGLLCAGDEGFDPVLWHQVAQGFALADHLDKPMYMLSTGSKRKVWLAAALASGRPLTLLDEPTGALDARSVACLWGVLAVQAARSDRAILLASAERVAQIPLTGTIELPLR